LFLEIDNKVPIVVFECDYSGKGFREQVTAGKIARISVSFAFGIGGLNL
jgi:hypothetical protein